MLLSISNRFSLYVLWEKQDAPFSQQCVKMGYSLHMRNIVRVAKMYEHYAST